MACLTGTHFERGQVATISRLFGWIAKRVIATGPNTGTNGGARQDKGTRAERCLQAKSRREEARRVVDRLMR